jgi:CBS domain-containing protein
VDVKEVLKKFRVRDILAREFLTLEPDATLAKALELMFHSHQEDFTVVDKKKETVGFITRQDIITGIHRFGTAKTVSDIMRKDFPTVKDTDTLTRAQARMEEGGIKAIPVTKDGRIAGIVTFEDIGRVYYLASARH